MIVEKYNILVVSIEKFFDLDVFLRKNFSSYKRSMIFTERRECGSVEKVFSFSTDNYLRDNLLVSMREEDLKAFVSSKLTVDDVVLFDQQSIFTDLFRDVLRANGITYAILKNGEMEKTGKHTSLLTGCNDPIQKVHWLFGLPLPVPTQGQVFTVGEPQPTSGSSIQIGENVQETEPVKESVAHETGHASPFDVACETLVSSNTNNDEILKPHELSKSAIHLLNLTDLYDSLMKLQKASSRMREIGNGLSNEMDVVFASRFNSNINWFCDRIENEYRQKILDKVRDAWNESNRYKV